MESILKNNYIKLTEIANNLDINKGDILLIGSDVTKLIMKCRRNNDKFDANLLIDSFKEKLGTEGTLLFPTYTFDFCKGITFDIKSKNSQMGLITNIAIDREDFVRTRHPIYSFAVTGKYAEYLANLKNKSSYGLDSPFHFLYENKAKMLVIGLDYQHSFTFVHYVEEKNNVNYRYMKNFTADYIDDKGLKTTETYSMYVRDIENNVETYVNPIGEVLENEGASVIKSINDINFTLIDLDKSNDIIEADIKNNAAKNLYRINKDLV